jgi:hypothetical protein
MLKVIAFTIGIALLVANAGLIGGTFLTHHKVQIETAVQGMDK